MKTVIHVWTQTPANVKSDDTHNFWGIGDLMRGVYGLYNLSVELGFRLIVDLSLHPVAQCLEVPRHEYSDLIQAHKDKILFVDPSRVKEHIQSQKGEVQFFITNMGLDVFKIQPSEGLKDFIKSLLKPNQAFQSYIDEQTKDVSLSYFNILHYRLGDNELVRKNTTRDFEPYLKHYRSHFELEDILMSDSQTFKRVVRDREFAITFDGPIGHMGYHSKKEDIQFSLFECLLVTKAQKIKSYSVHGYPSGFVFILSIIWDIPLECEVNI
jgi:hypothetical protein